MEPTPEELQAIEEDLCNRSLEWLATRHAVIKNKVNELQLLSPLTIAQRKLISLVEYMEQQEMPVRIIIPKSRKQGISTLVELIGLWRTIQRGLDFVVIANDKKLSEYIFGITLRFYEWLDKPFKPGIVPIRKPPLYKGTTNKGEMRFHNREGHIIVETANNVYAGTGMTPAFLHGSEVSKWEKGAEVATSLFQSIARKPGTYFILESTFNGFDSLFYPMWEASYKNCTLEWTDDLKPIITVTNDHDWNGFVPLFIPAMDDPDIYLRFHDTVAKERFLQTLDQYELSIKERFKVKAEFLYARRRILKEQCRGDLDVLKQEYPVDHFEAVRASNRGRFDQAVLDQMPIEEGERGELFVEGPWDREPKFRRDPTGFLVRFRPPIPSHRYVIGVDVAEGRLDTNGVKADATVASVHDCDMSLEQVAVMASQRLSETGCVQPLALLGQYYNNAFIVIESNSTGKLTCVQIAKIYPVQNLYHRDDWDQSRTRMRREVGHYTHAGNKAILIGSLAEVIHNQQIIIHSRDTLNELVHYIRLPGGGTEADAGFHDDHVMAVGFAVLGAKSYPSRLQTSPTPVLRTHTLPRPVVRTVDPVTGY